MTFIVTAVNNIDVNLFLMSVSVQVVLILVSFSTTCVSTVSVTLVILIFSTRIVRELCNFIVDLGIDVLIWCLRVFWIDKSSRMSSYVWEIVWVRYVRRSRGNLKQKLMT